MPVQLSAPRPARSAMLAGLVFGLVVALAAAAWPLGVPGAAAAPLITLFPDRGPCATRPEVRGMGFPAGAAIAIFTQRTSPPGEKAAQQLAQATADRNGQFRVVLLTINGDCIDLDARTPDGTQYTITAAVANTDGGPSAGAIYTIDRRVPANIRCYGETNHCVQGLFRGYWLSHGLDLGDPGISERESLALFGYPISDEFEQRLEDGRTYRVQYFERARMEYHPENPRP